MTTDGIPTSDETTATPMETTPGRAADDRRWVLFHVVVVLGILLGALLGILQVLDRPVIRLGDERVRRDGLVSTVQVLASNSSDDTTYCVEVRVAALDTEGLDLQEVAAEPQRGNGRLEPGQSVNFVAVFDEVTAQQYEEDLDEFGAYVDETERC